ncbi:MAG: alpha/beta fold hydrolase [Rhodospirillales bacterium]|jgi:pimeloyl-ACP methyl ester carboxylesterase
MPAQEKYHFILCPGFMLDDELWRDVQSGLEALGSYQFVDQRSGTSFTDIASNALQAAPAKFILIGFSMGGYVAREIYRLVPDQTQGLVLMNTSARPDSDAGKKRKQKFIELTKNSGFRGLSRKALRSSLHPDRQSDGGVIDFMQKIALRMGEEAFISQLAIERRDERADLVSITCPTLVIWSRQDALRSLEEAQELKDGILQAHLEIIEECGHMTPLEQPDKFLSILRNWLRIAE